METVIRAQGLTKRFGRHTAVDDVNVTLEGGRIAGLVGPNGAGKTTLLGLMADLLRPSAGSIEIAGVPVGPQSHGRVSYMPQPASLPRHSRGTTLLAWYKDMFDDFDAGKARALCREMDVDPGRRVGQLSAGNAEKLALALTLSRRAPVTILDEPLAGADPAAKRQMMDILRRQVGEDDLLLISTHLLKDMENLFDEVLFMQGGGITHRALADAIREDYGTSVDRHYEEVMRP